MDSTVTYPVQVLNKPHQVASFKAFHTLFVLGLVKYFVKLLRQVGCISVETLNLQQEWVSGWDHE